jgi:poly(ADP-ribose) glycohydrolase
LAIDAVHYRYHKQQFDEGKVVRELRKCYAGFYFDDNKSKTRLPVLATGNWGCGAFGGDRQLKFLIQMLVASETSRDLVYYTFNHKETVKNLNNIMSIIEKERLCVGDVYKLILEYSDEIRSLKSSDLKYFGICQFLETKFLDKILSSF